MVLKYNIKKADENKELKTILKNRLYISSRLLSKLKQSHAIFVNNNEVYTNYVTKENDEILIDLNILNSNKQNFSDKYIIINKPTNMPTHPSHNNYDNTLSNIIANYLEKQKIYNIHILTRLDKNTTGICIFAKNEYIQELFMRRKEYINLKKEYICIVNGIVEKDSGIIEKNIARKKGTIILREVCDDGDYAKTEYSVISRNYDKNYTVLKIILHTGRTHQIRVHMSYIGHPLLGDDMYSDKKDIKKYIDRQALHCYKISFIHPILKKEIDIVCKLPDDMKNLI